MKTVREFFSEVTDIDSRLVRTVIGLFRNPQRVVEASLEGQPTFTKPMRYLLFTSTIFIVWRFLYVHSVQNFFKEQYPGREDFWYMPGRIANASSDFINLQDTSFPFQILIFVVPLAFIPLRFFFNCKTWREARYVTLYSFGQFWIVLSILVPVLGLLEDHLLAVILIAFGLIGLFFRTLLSKKAWLGVAKWLVMGYFLTRWFYEIVLPATQWGLVQIVLPDRYPESEPIKPREEINLPVADGIEFITRDPDNRYLNELEKQEGLLVKCYKPDTTFLWQTLLPGVARTSQAMSVQLPSLERGFLILADGKLPNERQAILMSAEGKILFTKIYSEEMVLNGGEMVGETLILTGGKTIGQETKPVIDVFQLKIESGKEVFALVKERTYFQPGIGYLFDDVYALGNSPGGLDLVVSKYEITKLSEVSFPEVNSISIMRVKVDSALNILWEKEIFRRTSQYFPIRDYDTFQMQYDPALQRIIAFYSLANDRNNPSHLFSIDTLGTIMLQKKIEVKEFTYLTDVYSAREGIYFCGRTQLIIPSPFLRFGCQGLIGFISNNGDVSRTTVGKDKQGQLLKFYKIGVSNNSLMTWGVRERGVLMYEREWELLKFDRQLFNP